MSVIKLFIAAVLLTLSNMFCLHLVQSLLIFRLDSFPKHLTFKAAGGTFCSNHGK